MPVVSQLRRQVVKSTESMPLNPPPYTPRPPILRNNRYKSRKPERRATIMFLTIKEKCFLLLFAALSLMSILCTTGAIIVDKNAITGTNAFPSICMLSDTDACRTRFSSPLAKYIVAVGIRVDLLLSCITFVTGVMLTSFKIFNCRILVGFFLVSTFKIILTINAFIVILTTSFYYDTVAEVFFGICGSSFCINEDLLNILVAFFFILLSGFSNLMMMCTVFTLGSRIIRMFEDAHNEATWAKWDAMTADLVAY